ncbi:Nucleoside phosphorylase [Lactobacillus equicursoris DSM 19284 = JCM 14600 = CIP 110162]|uniref:adenosylhomocysteine nucleosidase n=3 Tax=Lactobacillus equicursoris TaxID=420645 RepID=K0NVS4_9LACO|nr:5'-methylthioadenosine/adenosylhomocysteine nucleosidase [Lactobacillus equicursoris]KRL02355.1 nucleoside phosphorylase [Lactobacillus equicursoris DSM 19284 = JCM 14600 = CIP 110162]MDD6386323.1 5'-methylthioadenosine/adenosylhomocysteine nucleosidase [Lactobacillus equicursoris]MST79489.1 5'-methylthioadenosine/adenosylhomocysteine nucleosidase [Lactobacillus equicursoris]CCK84351.1 Nucleoside phosphorylase [Lactobacillus equicursoris 66c]CCK85493.1 Nucleoside phosphorylase [Lactobacillu
MKIAIVVPMAEEAEFYHQYFSSGKKEMFGSTEFEHFSVQGNDLYLGLTGIGKVQAAMNLTSLLAKEKIDLVIMTGSAGSLNAKVRKEDLVLPTEFAYHDAHNTSAGNYVEGQIPQEPARFVLDSPARDQFKAFLDQKGIQYHQGLVVTGDSFISSQAQKDEIIKNFPDALCCEMEGAAFAQVAYHFNVPLIALRAISDNGDENADDDFAAFVKKVGAKAADMIVNFLQESEF